MPRKRTTPVTEPPAELLRLERQLPRPHRNRLKALRMIRQRPNASLGDIADAIGVSVAAVERWWALYREGGIDALLEKKQTGGYRPSKVNDALVAQIVRKRVRGELASQSAIQQWLEAEHGITISRSGVAYLLKTRQSEEKPMSRKPGRQIERSSSAPPSRSTPSPRKTTQIPKRSKAVTRAAGRIEARPVAGAGATPPLPEPALLMAIMNNLPGKFDIVGWVDEFRDMLRPLLPDVDRISVEINTQCDMIEPETYTPDIRLSQSDGDHADGSVDVTVISQETGTAEYVLARFATQGIDLAWSHPIVWREYHAGGSAYLGALFFWRDRHSAPISDATLAIVDQLETFITFLLSDLVARHDYAHPLERVYHDILRIVTVESKLSIQERRVLNLRLMGESYKSIASQLNVSQNAVRKHMTSVHRKTGTHSTVHLFAKYFTPRLAPGSKSLS